LRRVPATIEELGITRGKRQTHRARSSGPTIEPLIRALPSAGRPPTSGSLGTIASHRSSEAHPVGPHLYNWIVFGRKEEIFDFAE